MANVAIWGVLIGLIVLIVMIVVYAALNMKFLKDYERLLVWKWSGELSAVKGPGVLVLSEFQDDSRTV